MPPTVERTVIVTGASRGLGKAIALRFGAAGDRVAITFRASESEAHAVAEVITTSGGAALAIRADARDPSAVEQMISTVLERWGCIDVLVNNAGIVRDGLVLRMTEQDWDAVVDTDLKGPFVGIRSVVPPMVKQRGGHIINISSIAGVQGRIGQVSYSAAKAGLIGLTKSAARELGRYNIKANVVLPGYIETAMGRSIAGLIAEQVLRDNALGRANDLEEVAEFVYRLSLMNNVSGQIFNLDSRII